MCSCRGDHWSPVSPAVRGMRACGRACREGGTIPREALGDFVLPKFPRFWRGRNHLKRRSFLPPSTHPSPWLRRSFDSLVRKISWVAETSASQGEMGAPGEEELRRLRWSSSPGKRGSLEKQNLGERFSREMPLPSRQTGKFGETKSRRKILP